MKLVLFILFCVWLFHKLTKPPDPFDQLTGWEKPLPELPDDYDWDDVDMRYDIAQMERAEKGCKLRERDRWNLIRTEEASSQAQDGVKRLGKLKSRRLGKPVR